MGDVGSLLIGGIVVLGAGGLGFFLLGWQYSRRPLGRRVLVAWTRLVAVSVMLVSGSCLGSLALSALAPLGVMMSRLYEVSGLLGSPGNIVASPVGTPVRMYSGGASRDGLSVLVGPAGPSLSAAEVDVVLQRYRSPASGTGKGLFALSVRYGIDDAVALAFFWHESGFGVKGEARVTRSLGNLRCIPDAACIDRQRGGYAAFPTWEAGYEAWFRLIAGPLYVGDGRTTVEQIIPRYAPPADNNDVGAYIASVRQVVERLRAGRF